MKPSRVFVIQNPQIRDRRTWELRDKYNLERARDYGEIVHLLEPNELPFRPASIIRKLKEKLADFGRDDYLLLIGNPCLIGWACAIASGVSGGMIRTLQWDRASRSYILVEGNVADLPNLQ